METGEVARSVIDTPLSHPRTRALDRGPATTAGPRALDPGPRSGGTLDTMRAGNP